MKNRAERIFSSPLPLWEIRDARKTWLRLDGKRHSELSAVPVSVCDANRIKPIKFTPRNHAIFCQLRRFILHRFLPLLFHYYLKLSWNCVFYSLHMAGVNPPWMWLNISKHNKAIMSLCCLFTCVRLGWIKNLCFDENLFNWLDSHSKRISDRDGDFPLDAYLTIGSNGRRRVFQWAPRVYGRAMPLCLLKIRDLARHKLSFKW